VLFRTIETTQTHDIPDKNYVRLNYNKKNGPGIIRNCENNPEHLAVPTCIMHWQW
jgi:hypothetical protein